MKPSKGRKYTRRQTIGLLAGNAAALAANPVVRAQEAGPHLIVLDPAPRFKLSPYLYMQFMEPLGTTDGSVEAAWDHLGDTWRQDVLEVTRELAPPMLCWGGIFVDYARILNNHQRHGDVLKIATPRILGIADLLRIKGLIQKSLIPNCAWPMTPGPYPGP